MFAVSVLKAKAVDGSRGCWTGPDRQSEERERWNRDFPEPPSSAGREKNTLTHTASHTHTHAHSAES